MTPSKRFVLVVAFIGTGCGLGWSADTEPLASACEELSRAIVSKAGAGATIAVNPLSPSDDTARTAEVATAARSYATSHLARSGYLVVVEQRKIDEVLRVAEQQLSGAYDAKTVVTIGKLVGAKFLVLGETTRAESGYVVALRVVSVETSQVIAAETAEIGTDAVSQLVRAFSPPHYRVRLLGELEYVPEVRFLMYGAELSASYEFRGRHSVTLGVAAEGIGTRKGEPYAENSDGINQYVAEINPRDFAANASLGYGYMFDVSKFLALRPMLFCGVGLLQHKTYRSDLAGYYEAGSEDFLGLYVDASLETLVFRVSPIGAVVSVGYRQYLTPLKDTADNPAAIAPSVYEEYDVRLNSFYLKAGLSMYF